MQKRRAPSRSTVGLALVLSAATAGCRAGSATVEPGAVLLRIEAPLGVPQPDELRIWIYADEGALWRNIRIPSEGRLVPQGPDQLGTVLVQPGDVGGTLRVHVRGLVSGVRTLDAVLAIAPTDRRGTTAVALESAVPLDTDGDDVPDAIDDCPAAADPAQNGCPRTDDGGRDGDATAQADGSTDASETGGDAAGNADGSPAGDAAIDAAMDAAPAVDAASAADAAVDASLTADAANVAEAGTDAATAADAGVVADAAADAHADGSDCRASGSCNRSLGSVCTTAAQCGSGFCKDGFCCNTACASPCQTCGTGTCTTVTRAADPPECPSPMSCNPAGKCTSS